MGFVWDNVGPASQTVALHYISIGAMYVLSRKWPFWRRVKKASPALLCGSTPPPPHKTRDIESMLGQWPGVYDVGPTLTQHWLNASCLLGQPTRDHHPMLFQFWTSVEGCSSTLKHHSVNGMCLLMFWRKVYSRPSVWISVGPAS